MVPQGQRCGVLPSKVASLQKKTSCDRRSRQWAAWAMGINSLRFLLRLVLYDIVLDWFFCDGTFYGYGLFG